MAATFPMLWGIVTPEWATVWLTPLWLLSVGALVGLCALAVMAALWIAIHRRARQELRIGLTEGVLYPVTVVILVLDRKSVV